MNIYICLSCHHTFTPSSAFSLFSFVCPQTAQARTLLTHAAPLVEAATREGLADLKHISMLIDTELQALENQDAAARLGLPQMGQVAAPTPAPQGAPVVSPPPPVVSSPPAPPVPQPAPAARVAAPVPAPAATPPPAPVPAPVANGAPAGWRRR